ncbi:hypothetical protein TeGR_g2612 [Tetraparma gracilis]|uniref:Matrin-type domain-containing protein n=1 Tax=Tetraparma gracilis TaxID=2962635 RepID=A0ABQ6M489_9STRA|nr:hypothetical protein TeGR_g2612 [Tetraparma gracilis]
MDMQNRVGSKFGGGGLQSEGDAARDRKERLRQLALEQVDLSKDPYFMKNHLGTFECRLCYTLHTNEGSYLAHTQAKKHQANLARRAKEEQDAAKAQVLQTQQRASAYVGGGGEARRSEAREKRDAAEASRGRGWRGPAPSEP